MNSSNKNKKILNHRVEILPVDTEEFPSHLKDFHHRSIQRESIFGELNFDLSIPVSDLVQVAPDGENVRFKVFKFGLINSAITDERLFGLLDNNTPVYLTDLAVRGWFHDSPFSLEVSSNKVKDSVQLVAKAHHKRVDLKLDDKSFDQYPVLSCPPILLTSTQPTNDIEEDLLNHGQPELVDSSHCNCIFGGDDATNKFISTFSFVSQKSVTDLTVANKGQVVTPMTSLLGLISRMLGNTYPLVTSNPNFDENNTYFLKMDHGVAQSCNDIIKQSVQALDMYSRTKLVDIQFGLKVSQIGTRWRYDRDTDSLCDTSIDVGHARTVSLSEHITIKFKVFIGIVVLDPNSENLYATDPMAKNVPYFDIWPHDALDAQGKPLPVLNSRGGELFKTNENGKKVRVLRQPYQHIDTIYKLQKTGVYQEQSREGKRTASSSDSPPLPSSPSSSSSSSLMDD